MYIILCPARQFLEFLPRAFMPFLIINIEFVYPRLKDCRDSSKNNYKNMTRLLSLEKWVFNPIT